MNFTFKSLIALVVTSSALLLTPMRSDAQVNMNILAKVAQSCQRDALSPEYYQQMDIDLTEQHYFGKKKAFMNPCIRTRYHYFSVLSKLPWMASKGEMLPNYPGYIAILATAMNFAEQKRPNNLIECIASQNALSQPCQQTNFYIAETSIKIKKIDIGSVGDESNYLTYVCPSCAVTHDNIFSKEIIISAFIKWFLELEKPQRREIMSILGADEKADKLRDEIHYESLGAVGEYWDIYAQVEKQEQEQRRQELLGN